MNNNVFAYICIIEAETNTHLFIFMNAIITYFAFLILTSTCTFAWAQNTTYASACMFTVENVTQSSLSCRDPVLGFDFMTRTECVDTIRYLESSQVQVTTDWLPAYRCEKTQTCGQMDCLICKSVERTMSCHDLLRFSPSLSSTSKEMISTSCSIIREVETPKRCDCQCSYYLYILTGEKQCWKMQAFQSSSEEETISKPFVSTLCRDMLCVTNFTQVYEQGTQLPIIGCASSGSSSTTVLSSSSSAEIIQSSSTGAASIQSISSSSTGSASITCVSTNFASPLSLFSYRITIWLIVSTLFQFISC